MNTNNKVKTSIVVMSTTLFRETRGHNSENRILLSVQLYSLIISWIPGLLK